MSTRRRRRSQACEVAGLRRTFSRTGKTMPRHRTSSPYCVACRLRYSLCVCAQAPHLNLATRLVVIMHSKEWGSLANTGHFTRLALRNTEIRLHGLSHQTVSRDGLDTASVSTLVLFPGGSSYPLTEQYLAPLPRPLTLLVPDGTWNQAKNMMRRIPMLREAHRVRLEVPSLGLPCSRRNIGGDRRSTFEAIAQTLGILEGQEMEDHLLRFFRQVLDRRKQDWA